MSLTLSEKPMRRRASSLWLAAAVATAVCVLFLALGRLGACPWAALCGPLLADDVAQARLDIALPAPQGALVIEQSFVARRNGLTSVDVLLARYDGQPAADAHFDVALWDDAGVSLAAVSLPVSTLSHNQTYSLTFAPQRASAGRRYTLRLSGSADNPISAWGYSLDVYSDGALSLDAGPLAAPPATAARELRFTTRYALTAGDALVAAVRPLRQDAGLLLAAALLLPLPGVWLLLAARPRRWGAAWAGAALALGVAAWPILWLWLTLAGGRWSGPSLWALVAVGWLGAALVGGRRTMAARPRPERTPVRRSLWRWSAARRLSSLLLLTAVALAVRFVAVRDLAFPPWVDSSRHALITAVMVASGRAPDGYAPYLPVQGFPYHFGFHTLSAGLALMTGRPLPELLLTLGQLLNGLVPLSVYAAGRLATRRHAAGLLAAFLVALPFFFPGYYATWGRMTQLAAMLIMPVLLALTWRLGRGTAGVWPLAGVLAAGLFLTHFRVFLFYLPYALLVAVMALLMGGRARAAGVFGLLKAGVLALLLVGPRVARLLADTDPLATFGQTQPGYNAFPIGYVTTGWERLYLGLAALAVVVVLVAVLLRRRWAVFPLLLVVWVVALFALLAGDRLGLPETLVVNLNSMYITLFLPLALLLAIVATRRPLPATRRPLWSVVRGLSSLLAGLALGLLALFGARQQANILNPTTILALPQDAAALDWMAAHLPAEARVAVNAWPWLGVTWAGSDGGAWITPLTGRQATTPPVDHIYDPELFAAVRAFNDGAAAIDDWGDPAAAAWLRAQGVTHVYAGQRGGPFDPAALSRNPGLSLLFQHEGTFVFAVRP